MSPDPVIAISTGDPNGIGIEVTLKTLAALRGGFRTRLYGSEDAIRYYGDEEGFEGLLPPRSSQSDPDARIQIINTASEADFSVSPGQMSAASGEESMRALSAALDDCLGGRTDALVTAPISKEAISMAGYNNPGHTEFLVERCGGGSHAMLMIDGRLRLALATTHIPLSDVAAAITPERILDKLRVFDAALRIDFGLEHPHIAVLGLNPHAGENGRLGREELDVIIPALKQARSEGLFVEGPFPSDGFFGMRRDRSVDGVLAMYHDQGLLPFKTLAFETGVNVTAGLPVVRTSPDHGTAFEIAGQNRASFRSMEQAISLAVQITNRRIVFRESGRVNQ